MHTHFPAFTMASSHKHFGSKLMIVDSNLGKQSVESRFGGSWFHARNVVGSLGKDFLKTHSIATGFRNLLKTFTALCYERMPSVMEGMCQKLKCPKMSDTC